MTSAAQTRLDDFARRLRALEDELDLLRWQITAESSQPATAITAEPEPAMTAPEPALPFPSPTAPPSEPERPQLPAARRPEPRAPWFELPSLELSDLLGARALALAGGVVTLLGIVFFFVLAVNRGWVGPVGRVGLGATAAFCLFLAGIELRRRFGETHSALAAVGAGLAGGYATLLAAAAVYHLLPNAAALVVASGIACIGVATAIAWRSEIVAGLGLLGALLAPVAIAAQDGISPLGTAFAAFVLAGTLVVALQRRWYVLLVAGVVASAPQIVVLILEPENEGKGLGPVVLLAAIFALLYLGAGIAYQLRLGREAIGQLTTSLTIGAGVLAAIAAVRLFGSAEATGFALLAVALTYGLLAAVFFVRSTTKDLSALLAAAGFILGAFAFAGVLSGQPLAYAWAAEAAALAWLGRRTRELRFQIWAAGYLVLSLLHVLLIDAPPRHLFVATADPTAGAPAVLALAAAAAVFASQTGTWPGRAGAMGLLSRLFNAFARGQQSLRHVTLWGAGVLTSYAVSLGVLAIVPSFDWAEVVLAALWSVIALALLLIGLVRDSAQLRSGGLAWLAVAMAAVTAHTSLEPTPRGTAMLIVAAALLAAGLAYQLLLPDLTRLDPVSAVAILLSVVLACAGLSVLPGVASPADTGIGLLALAALYGLLSAAVWRRPRQRDLTTALWGTSLVLAAFSVHDLLHGTAADLAWALAGVALAWLSARLREPRLIAGAGAYLGLALGHALTVEALPTHLFSSHSTHGGAAAALPVAAAIAVSSYVAPRLPELAHARRLAWWLAGVLGLYGVSLAILELLQGTSAGTETAFHTGHTVVSAVWGLLALVLLYAGLTRWRSLRVVGLALFALSLAKLFLFDLSSLDSITRALSFLAVGAVLLLGGFFYQRLSSGRTGAGNATTE